MRYISQSIQYLVVQSRAWQFQFQLPCWNLILWALNLVILGRQFFGGFLFFTKSLLGKYEKRALNFAILEL